MYPVIILFGKDVYGNKIYEDYYGHIDELSEIINIIKKIFKDIFKQNYDMLETLFHTDENFLSLERFCESQWQEPYDDSLFFDIKYFDCSDLQWKDYVIKHKKLQKIITKLAKKIKIE
jgi:hypothetical protein